MIPLSAPSNMPSKSLLTAFSLTLPTVPTEWISFFLYPVKKLSYAIESPGVSKLGFIDSTKAPASSKVLGKEAGVVS